MLLDFRETIRGSKPLKYTLIGLICVPFALVGIGSYFAGGTAPAVATVDGEEIDALTLDRAYRQQRQRFAQVFGGSIPDALDDEALLRRQALDQLVADRVLAGEVAAQRFAVGDETLGRAIRQRPEFQRDGAFDRERYTQLVASAGGVAAFEAQYRDQTALDQFRGGIVATGFTLPQEAARLDSLARQTRTVDAVRFDLDAARQAIEVSDEDVVARFEETADDYRFPPRARIAYIELSADTVADTLDVSEDEAAEWYAANRGRFGTTERREASHILLATDGDATVEARTAEAEALLARLEAGESFEDLALEASDDTGSAANGGSLGEVSAELMDPPLVDAAFALAAVGDVSDPVVTDFGVHLMRLDSITEGTAKPFAELDDTVRDEVMAAAKLDAASAEFGELREALTETAFDEPESLEAASEATGLPVQRSDWLDIDTDSGPVLSSPAVRAAMFSDDVLLDGNNSDPVEVGDRHLVVLRVVEDEGERPKALEDVRDEVLEALRTERAGEILDARVESAEAALADGAEPAALAAADDATGTPVGEPIEGEVLTRDAATFDAATVAALFAAPAPTDAAPVTGASTLDDGDRLAWRLVSIDRPEAVVAATPASADGDAGDTADASAVMPAASPPASGADPRLGGVEFSALVDSLRARADVEIEADLSPELPQGY